MFMNNDLLFQMGRSTHQCTSRLRRYRQGVLRDRRLPKQVIFLLSISGSLYNKVHGIFSMFSSFYGFKVKDVNE